MGWDIGLFHFRSPCRYIKRFVKQLAREKHHEKEYALYEKVEHMAPEIIGEKRRMYKGVNANVDFYSGLVYSMLDLPPALYTPIFAAARIVGWSATGWKSSRM